MLEALTEDLDKNNDQIASKDRQFENLQGILGVAQERVLGLPSGKIIKSKSMKGVEVSGQDDKYRGD